MSARRREVDAILKEIQKPAYGCEVVPRGRRGHWKVRRPGYGQLTISPTPSDHRAVDNIRADLKRYLDIEL